VLDPQQKWFFFLQKLHQNLQEMSVVIMARAAGQSNKGKGSTVLPSKEIFLLHR
jgi:hypothetical protein